MDTRPYRAGQASAAGDAVPHGCASVLEALGVGQTVATAVLYGRIGDSRGGSSTRDGGMAMPRKAMAFAAKAGIAFDATRPLHAEAVNRNDRRAKAGIAFDATRPPGRPHDGFLRIPCVAR